MVKTASKAPKEPTAVDDSLVRKGSNVLGMALDALETYTEAAAAELKATDVNVAERGANHLATIGVRVAQIVAELRKIEHAEKKAAGEVTDRQVLDYFRQLKPTDRAQWMRDIEGMDRRKGAFG